MKTSSEKSIRLFKSDFLERFSHIHPITPLIFWAPVITYLFWRSVFVSQLSAQLILGLSLSGIFVWTVTEYILHRWVFHYNATTQLGKLVMFFAHGIHHSTPQDKTRLVMPLPMAILIAIVLFTVFRGFLGAVLVEPFFGAFLVGYLIYDYSHYAIHHFRPKTRFGRMLKQHHMDHHYVDHASKFGVSSPFWDYLFGTADFKTKIEVPQFKVMSEKEVENYNSKFSGRPAEDHNFSEQPAQGALDSHKVKTADKMETLV